MMMVRGMRNDMEWASHEGEGRVGLAVGAKSSALVSQVRVPRVIQMDVL